MVVKLARRVGAKLIKLGNIGFGASFVNGLIDRQLPQASNSVTVSAAGSRIAKRDDLFRLALAIATGTVKRFGRNTSALINVEIDHVDKIVKVFIKYEAGGAIQGGLLAAGQILNIGGLSAIDMIREPIREGINGGTYPPFLEKSKDEPIYTGVGKILANRITDATMTTADVAPNPFPPFDGVSRSTDLTAILAAAFSPPCCPPAALVQSPYPVVTNPTYSLSPTGVRTIATPGKVGF